MTEKLFTMIICSNDEYTGSLYLNDEPLKIDDVCKLLNEQHEEIQRLQESLNYSGAYITAKKKKGAWRNDLIDELKKENEQLKQQLKECTAKTKEEIRKQKEENAIRWANIGG